MESPRWRLILLLVLPAVACQPAQEAAEPAASATDPTESWQCRNDLEISCDAQQCEAAEGFTPMDVRLDDGGAMSVCAYSGCWEGTGTVADSEHFLVLTGEALPFSTAPDAADRAGDIVIALDKTDHVAVLKAGAFAQPLLCEQLDGSP